MKTIPLILIVLGLLLAFGGSQLDMPLLLNAGLSCLGLAMIAMGWDAILTQHIVIGSRRRGSRRTYKGLAAILQGVQFNIIGLCMIGVAFLMFTNTSPESFGTQIARRPGFALIALGIVFLIQAAVLFIGHEVSDRSSFGYALDLVAARLLPGLILFALGAGAIWLGLFEITAPGAFDEMGGRILENFYGTR